MKSMINNQEDQKKLADEIISLFRRLDESNQAKVLEELKKESNNKLRDNNELDIKL